MINSFRQKITTGVTATPVTTTFTDRSCAITGIFISVNDAGSAWTLLIRDRSTLPAGKFVMLPALTLAKTTDEWHYKHFDDPIYMDGGIEAVTTGTTAGEVAVWIIVLQA